MSILTGIIGGSGDGGIGVLSVDALLHVEDQKPAGTDGGTFTAGAWRTRDLNTVMTNTIAGASLASNQVTLPAGEYWVEATIPGVAVSTGMRMVARLYDVANSVQLIQSNDGSASPSSAGGSSFNHISGIVSLSAETNFQLQHYSHQSTSNIGFGQGSDFGQGHSKFSVLKIWKVG